MHCASFARCVRPLGLAWLAACAAPSQPTSDFEATVERQLACMGTRLTVQVQAVPRSQALALSEQVVRSLEAAELRLTTWHEQGELAQLNAGVVTRPSELLQAELDAAEHWSAQTGGAFQPRCAALLAAWDLRGSGRLPSQAQRVAAAADHSRWDEGAWGKGAGLDQVAERLQLTAEQRVQIDLGGQWLLIGTGSFELAVAHPLDRSQPFAQLRIAAGSVATSGNSQRAVEVAGQRVGHILDPRTGSPIDRRGSVSVWHPSALAADCVSTALFVLGPDAAMRWAREHSDFEVLFLEVTPQDEIRVHATPGFEEQITVLAHK